MMDRGPEAGIEPASCRSRADRFTHGSANSSGRFSLSAGFALILHRSRKRNIATISSANGPVTDHEAGIFPPMQLSLLVSLAAAVLPANGAGLSTNAWRMVAQGQIGPKAHAALVHLPA